MEYVYRKALLPEPVLEAHPDWVDLYYLAWEIAFRRIEYVEKPGWKPQLTCMPGSGVIWLWDSCFTTMITNYSNGTLTAFNNLDNIYRLRRKEDGYISMAYRLNTEQEAFGGRINPPLAAWAEWRHYAVTGDASRFPGVIDALEGLYGYIENTHRRNCGLYWFEDPGSSGMDNSPRGGYASQHLDGSDVCFVDLACQQALSARCLSAIFGVLGNAEKADFYRREHTRICELINRYHWCEREGFYLDFFARSRPDTRVKFLNTKTAAAFWALLCGCADREKARRMRDHLFSRDEFYAGVPFASLSADDPNYDVGGGYWLGSVWPPTNYAAIKGLEENGYHAEARQAARDFLAAMASVAGNSAYGGIWEAYAPERHTPATTESGELVRDDFVGWGGLGPIPLLIETVIGLRFDAPHNAVHFRLAEKGRFGLKNMCFQGQTVSIVAQRSRDDARELSVTVTAERPFDLVLYESDAALGLTIPVPAGTHSYRLKNGALQP